MNITTIKTDKKNKRHINSLPLEELLASMAQDDAQHTIEEIRLRIPLLQVDRVEEYEPIQRLPRIYPAAEFTRSKEGDLKFKSCNGVLLLTARGLQTEEETQRIKSLAAQLPMTLCAIEGMSGRSVKILVRIALADGTLPSDETGTDSLIASALPQAMKLYNAMLGVEVIPGKASSHCSFRKTLDPEPYYNPAAQPLLIKSNSEGLSQYPITNTPNPVIHREVDYKKYADNEFLYRQAVTFVQEQKQGQSLDEEAFLTALAARLCKLGMQKEEAIQHITNHNWESAKANAIRAIVDAVYAEEGGGTVGNRELAVRKGSQQMIDFLESKYVFRYNTVMGYTEFRPNNSYLQDYQPVSKRIAKRFALEARLQGVNVWDADITRYIESDFVPEYNPIQAYLDQCHGKWDGRDRIRELARTIPTDNPYWADWFYTWFLGMVKQWSGSLSTRYGNSVAPLLISKQGYNKSTFCRRLLPPELRWGYIDNLQIAEKKQVLQAMSQYLLINLDEFNQISANLQQGFLKNTIQLATVKGKRPYGKHVEDFPRLASFIATANMSDVLTDPTGNRRFIGVEITAPIDVKYEIDYEQLYAQAQQAIEAGELTYFDAEQTRLIMDYNQQFQMITPIEGLFATHFHAATANEEGAEWMTSTEIYEILHSIAGSSLTITNLKSFGTILTNVPGIQKRHSRKGACYWVKRDK